MHDRQQSPVSFESVRAQLEKAQEQGLLASGIRVTSAETGDDYFVFEGGDTLMAMPVAPNLRSGGEDGDAFNALQDIESHVESALAPFAGQPRIATILQSLKGVLYVAKSEHFKATYLKGIACDELRHVDALAQSVEEHRRRVPTFSAIQELPAKQLVSTLCGFVTQQLLGDPCSVADDVACTFCGHLCPRGVWSYAVVSSPVPGSTQEVRLGCFDCVNRGRPLGVTRTLFSSLPYEHHEVSKLFDDIKASALRQSFQTNFEEVRRAIERDLKVSQLVLAKAPPRSQVPVALMQPQNYAPALVKTALITLGAIPARVTALFKPHERALLNKL